jgi:hypothetical protein
VPIYKKDDKTYSSICRGISLLPTTYKILCSTLFSRLSPYVDEIIGDHQCGFRSNRSATDQDSAFGSYWRKHGTAVG